MLGGLAIGETAITGLLEGEDVHGTAQAMAALGAMVSRDPDGIWRVVGCGVGGLQAPDTVLDMGNSGTGARLLLGILAGHGFTTFLTGDASLRSRPMERVMGPLRQMGAQFVSRDGGRLPLAVTGTAAPLPMVYRAPIASAQVKSAVLLAGLHAPGETTVVEPAPSRDHSERMLADFGAEITTQDMEGGARAVTITGQPELVARPITVPADPSSAAFPVVAGLITPGATVIAERVGMNPLRAGLYKILQEMGADLTIEDVSSGGEPMATITARHSKLRGVTVPAAIAPSMIDEYPILAVAAACAEGETRMEGVGELRVKETDRIDAMVSGLTACGVDTQAGDDWMTVRGVGGTPTGGGSVTSRLDHRIAMSFLVLGMAAGQPVTVDDVSPVDTSFPGFVSLMNGLGGRIEVQG